MPQSYPNQALGKRKVTRRPLVLASIVIAMFMAAIEGTIVATAMPSIVGDLGGFSLYSWVFSAFLLMTAVTTLIYGKLSDLFGRKPIFIFGVIVFLIGSVLCGAATSMTMLVFSRFIQGIGAGAVQPISQTIVGDMYTIEERAKIQGYLSSVWGISAVTGPLIGGLIVQYADWAWIFWMNIPLGLLGMFGVLLFFHENMGTEQRQIDYAGASFIFVAVVSLMVVLIQGGVAWSWFSWPSLILLGLFALSFFTFLWRESQAPSPIMPLGLWRHRLIAVANAATLTSGMIMIGLSSFLPMFVQGVMGYSAVIAGFSLTMMSVGWPIASSFAGHIFLRIGYRMTAILGGLALFSGGLFFVFLDLDKGPVWAGTGSFLTGIGMGLTTTTFIVSIQNKVGRETRGIATASNMFMRMLGSSLGAAVLGGILNTKLQHAFDGEDASLDVQISVHNVNQILAGSRKLSDQAMQIFEKGLASALHNVYIGVFVFAIVTLLLAIFLPKPHRENKDV